MPNIAKWDYNEQSFSNVVPVVGRFLEINVPRSMTDRRIYCWLNTLSAGNPGIVIEAYIVGCVLDTSVFEIPVGIYNGKSLTQPKSLFSLCVAGNSANPDTGLLQLATTLDGGQLTQGLQPFRINVEVDKMRIDIRRVLAEPSSGLLGFQCFLGCLSGVEGSLLKG